MNLQDAPNLIYAVLFFFLWLLLISLPGIGLTYLGWKLSRGLQPTWVRNLIRATLIAIALAPSIYGHAGPMPAIFVAFATSGRDRFVGIVPILIVWMVAIPVVTAFAKDRKQRP